jgi:hypothetical protein
MSLELKIEALTAAVIALTARMDNVPAATFFTPAAPIVAAPAVITVQAAAAPSVAAVSGTPVAMPAPPTFSAPSPLPVATGATAPFTDGKGVIDYVMASYKALGPQKGAQIQGVLTGMGYANINEVKPEMYGALYAGVEALKG